jgi:hypothetical protein
LIIRRLESSLQLITQPDHAALAARILSLWDDDHFPDSPRKASILHAIAQHDNGWAEVDEALCVDPASGELLDFVGLPDAFKRETSVRGIERLANDPYAAALVAQHRLHVYRRYTEHPEWRDLFPAMAEDRDRYLRASGASSLDQLLEDYKLLRSGDLASLAFCNNWTDIDPDGYGYTMRLEGTTLLFEPDPFGRKTHEFEIAAKEIPLQTFASEDEARRVVEAAPVVMLRGRVSGAG